MKINKTMSTGWSRLSAGFFWAPLLSASLLTACGGGGDGDSGPCGGPGNLALDVTYEVNGQLVDPSRLVILARDAPVQATPRALGLPAACAGAARLTVGARSTVPPGLVFDAATGAFSGTPTARANFSVDLRLSVDGYAADVRRTVDFLM